MMVNLPRERAQLAEPRGLVEGAFAEAAPRRQRPPFDNASGRMLYVSPVLRWKLMPRGVLGTTVKA